MTLPGCCLRHDNDRNGAKGIPGESDGTPRARDAMLAGHGALYKDLAIDDMLW